MIEDIIKNIDSEIEILREISLYSSRLALAGPYERNLILSTIESLKKSMRLINESIPNLLSEISMIKKLDGNKQIKEKFERINYQSGFTNVSVTIHAKNKRQLLKELSIKEEYIKRLKKKRKEIEEEHAEFKASRGYLKLTNKLFLETANKWIQKGYFKGLSKDLRKANIEVLFQTYVAMMFMTTLLSIIFGIFLVIFLMFFSLHIELPFVSIYKGSYLTRFLQIFWIPFILPVVTFFGLYYYPATERGTLARRIDRELPFAVIHMSAISGSGIQPSEIFRIIGLSREYPYLRKEIRKVLNQINLYGYDLVTALNNTASGTPSTKLAELFSGLGTTINSGGDFSEFFNKRAETLMIDYRLEREKYTKAAETFMDLYISIVIAAPMVLMLLMILLIIGSFDVGLSVMQVSALIISITVLINVFFLIFIHLKQPNY